MFTNHEVMILSHLRECADLVAYEVSEDISVSQVIFFRIDGVWIRTNPIQTLGGSKVGLTLTYGIEPSKAEYKVISFK